MGIPLIRTDQTLNFLSNKKTTISVKSQDNLKCWLGQEMIRRKNLPLRSHTGPYLLFLQILPDSPQTWCMPKAAINDSSLPRSGLSRDLPLLPTRSGPSSLFLLCANHLWPQLYFPSFPQRLKSQP